MNVASVRTTRNTTLLTECDQDKHQVDEKEVPSLKPHKIQDFIEGIGRDGVLS
jgi:hypothetical protein